MLNIKNKTAQTTKVSLKVTLLTAMVSMGLMACDTKMKLDEMHSSTVHMDKTTTNMNGNMESMKSTTEDMKNITDNMNKNTDKMSQSTEKMQSTMEDMKKVTNDLSNTMDKMKNRMDEMSDTTKNVSEKSEKLDKKTEELYDSLRQGDAASLRRQFLESMNASNEIPKKLGMATKYFWAYEFQLWSGQGLDDKLRREELAASASREFLREVQEFSPQVKFIDPASEDNNDKNFLALATTMHMVNDKQVIRAKNINVEEYSLYHFFEVALKENRMLQQNKISYSQLSWATKEILFFPERVVQLLQARQNFIMAMFLDKGLGISQMGLLKKLTYALGRDWTLDLKTLNDVEIEKIREYTEGIAKTMRILNENGIKLQIEKKVFTIFSNCKIAVSKSINTERTQKESELVKYFNEIVQQKNIEKM